MKRSEKIKEFRIKMGLTQEGLAKKVNCSPGYISQIENEIRKPSLKFLGKIKEIWGISSDSLLYNSPSDREEVGLAEQLKECNEEGQIIPPVRESGNKYKVQTIATKKLLDNVVKILESGNKTAIEALLSNIKAFLEMVRISKNTDKNKGGD